MKIVYLSPTRFPTERAHGAQIAHMCNAFSELDHVVTLVVPYRAGNSVKESPFSYYNIKESFEVKYVYCMPWGVGFWFGFWTNFITYTLRALLLVVFSKIDVVYSRDEYVLYFTSLFSGKKLVWESHEAKYNFAAKKLLASGLLCVAISEGIKEYYVSQGVAADQIVVAHDGIDNSFFRKTESKGSARKRLGIETEKPVAMYIGGLDKWKGAETFLEASKYNDSIDFMVIGGRDDEIERYTKQFPMVTFLGPRPYCELMDNQQAVDILVIPNTKRNELSAKYTSPLKLFTHLASRVPLVVSDIPSLRNVVSENEVTYFKPDEPQDLAEKIVHVLADKESSNYKAKNAFQLSKRYTWQKRAIKIVSSMNII